MRDKVTFFTQYNEPGGTASPPEVRALISPLINQLTSCVFTLFKEVLMFNFKRFAMAFIGVLALCSIEARAHSFVITNVSGFLAVDVLR